MGPSPRTKMRCGGRRHPDGPVDRSRVQGISQEKSTREARWSGMCLELNKGVLPFSSDCNSHMTCLPPVSCLKAKLAVPFHTTGDCSVQNFRSRNAELPTTNRSLLQSEGVQSSVLCFAGCLQQTEAVTFNVTVNESNVLLDNRVMGQFHYYTIYFKYS